MPPELLAFIAWLKREWPTILVTVTPAGAFLIALEKWRGQRLSNQKLRLEAQKLELEVKAMSLALRKEELQRVAQEITGKSLPETTDAPAAFRAALEEWAKDRALAELHAELDELKDRLAASEEALVDFSCPHCGAPLLERQTIPLNDERNDLGTAESYECGHTTSDLGDTRPCPSDPKFPKLDEFELVTSEQKSGGWTCWPKPLTVNARRLQMLGGRGRTEEEAIESIKSEYARCATKWTGR
jgi:hypothetical protein